MSAARKFMGAIVACAVPMTACGLDVSGSGTSTGGTGSSGVVPLGDPDAGARDAGVTPTGSGDAAIEAATVADATLPADAATSCDLDGDGHNGKSCGGDDCCDNDARVHPGTNAWYDTASACGSFDYDCNGQEEREHGVKNCHLTFGCFADEGFDKDTACGTLAGYSTCYGVFTCHEAGDTRTQRCR